MRKRSATCITEQESPGGLSATTGSFSVTMERSGAPKNGGGAQLLFVRVGRKQLSGCKRQREDHVVLSSEAVV